MTHEPSQLLIAVAIVVLIAWRLQARIRRMIARQKLSRVRPWVNLVLFPLLIALLALGAHVQPLAEEALAAGVVLGIVLGWLGLRQTRFEASTDGLYYTPSAHIGVVLSVLLVGRIVWRFLNGGVPGAADGAAPQAPQLTPLTLLLLGTLAAYYCSYAAGLLRWSYRSRTLSPRPETPS